jgi:pimeloyl-[acyl-carrier protein] synthase
MDLIRKFLGRMKQSEEATQPPEVSAPVAAPEPPPLDLDPLAPDFVANPYPLLARLRQEEPVHRNTSALWVLTRYADIVAALGDARFGNAPSPYAVVNARNRHRYVCADVANNIIPFLDPPEHDTPRRLIGRAFAGKMRHQPPDLKALAEEFIAPLREKESFDVLHDFGTPFAVAAIGRTLGVPPEEESLLKEWSHWFFYLFMMIPSQEVRQRLDEALTAFRAYFRERLEKVRATPDDSLLSGLAPSGLSDAEIVDTCMLLFADGVENVDRAIASGTALILAESGLWQQLGASPELIPAVVDECLRFESPALFVGRVAREDITLQGRTIGKNSGVLLMLGSGNRDPEAFPEAEQFQPERKGNKHLAFGVGKHSCIGGPLVKLEMIAAFEALTQAFPRLTLTGTPLEWTPRIGHRWLSSLPVRNKG